MFKKEIVKGIYDIAERQGKTIKVASEMMRSNLQLKKEVHEGSTIDYNSMGACVSKDEIQVAITIALDNYDTIVKARKTGNYGKFDTLFA